LERVDDVASEIKEEYDRGFPSCARRSLVAIMHQLDLCSSVQQRPSKLTFADPILAGPLQYDINMKRPLGDWFACLAVS
jgi:hypothetical protein